jgi:hypothetical protein
MKINCIESSHDKLITSIELIKKENELLFEQYKYERYKQILREKGLGKYINIII